MRGASDIVPPEHQVQTTGPIPQVKFSGKVMDVLVVVQRQVPRTEWRHRIDNGVNIPFGAQKQIPMHQTIHKTNTISQVQYVDTVVGVLVVQVAQVPQVQVAENENS